MIPVTRVLPVEEWARLQAFEPFASNGLPDPEQWRVVVAERGAEIVGFCCIFAGAHWEPWYVAPSHRRNPVVARGLIQRSKQLLEELSIPMVFAVVSDALPEQQAIVERLGFTPAPGRLYVLNVADLEV